MCTGVWKNKFDPSKTSEDTFYVNDEETIHVDMMQANKYPLSYFTFEKLDSQVSVRILVLYLNILAIG